MPAQPAGELPVAAYPALAAPDVVQVVAGMILIEKDIADQPGAGMAALQQVMAEDEVLGKARADRPLEGIDIVDALADIGALVEQVLIEIGDGPRVRVDARFPAEQPRIARAVGAFQAGRDAGLKNAVAIDDPVRQGGMAGAVERMGHGADQLASGIAGKLGVAVQRDHVDDVRQRREIPDDPREALSPLGLRPATQQGVEVGELAALALMAHPAALLGVPAARAVEEIERRALTAQVAPVFRIAGVQPRDAVVHPRQQGIVIGSRGLRGIAEVGQQGTMQASILVGQEAHLEGFQQGVDAGGIGQQGRCDDQRPRRRGDAVLDLHAR